MAVLVPKNESGTIGRTSNKDFYKLGVQTIPEIKFSHIISETYYIGQKFKDQTPAKHYFLSAWSLDQAQWKTEEGFLKYFKEEAEKLSNS